MPIYGTYTDPSNYERLAIKYASNVVTFASEAAGTGTARAFSFTGAGVTVTSLTSSGIVSAGTFYQFGGATASYPALKRSATSIAVRLADDSADAPLTSSTLQATDSTANTSAIVTTAHSLTGSSAVSMVDQAGTWNTSGTPTLVKYSLTDTASNAASLLQDFQVGGVSKYKIAKTGAITATAANIGGATDYLAIEADGTLVFNGTATVWDDIGGDAVDLQQTGTGVGRNATESTVDFITTANLSDYMYTQAQMPHGWKIGSVIFPHIHAFQTTSAAPNYLLQYRWQTLGGSKTTAWTSLACNAVAFTYVSGTLHQLFKTASGITPPGGAALSDIVQFRILRDNANTSTLFAGADPVAATVAVLSFDVHIEKDTIGSRAETTK